MKEGRKDESDDGGEGIRPQMGRRTFFLPHKEIVEKKRISFQKAARI